VTVEELLAAARSRLERLDPDATSRAIAAGALLVDIRVESQRAADGAVPEALFIPRNVLRVALRPRFGDTSESPRAGRSL
jgi:hypothetical protein